MDKLTKAQIINYLIDSIGYDLEQLEHMTHAMLCEIVETINEVSNCIAYSN